MPYWIKRLGARALRVVEDLDRNRLVREMNRQRPASIAYYYTAPARRRDRSTR